MGTAVDYSVGAAVGLVAVAVQAADVGAEPATSEQDSLH
jgi:hypothetical protein